MLSIFSCAIWHYLYTFFDKSFIHFFNWDVYLLLSFEGLLYILDKSPSSHLWFANIFSQTVACLFILSLSLKERFSPLQCSALPTLVPCIFSYLHFCNPHSAWFPFLQPEHSLQEVSWSNQRTQLHCFSSLRITVLQYIISSILKTIVYICFLDFFFPLDVKIKVKWRFFENSLNKTSLDIKEKFNVVYLTRLSWPGSFLLHASGNHRQNLKCFSRLIWGISWPILPIG